MNDRQYTIQIHKIEVMLAGGLWVHYEAGWTRHNTYVRMSVSIKQNFLPIASRGEEQS